MPLQSAHGGSVQVGTGMDLVVVPVGRWSGNWRVRSAEVTQSDSGGSTLEFPVVQENEWEFSVARDDAAFPEAIGLDGGTIVPLMWFKLGAGSMADKLVNTLVLETNPVVDNTNDVVRVTVRGKGGKVTKNQTIS
jgi:hypothetical protein